MNDVARFLAVLMEDLAAGHLPVVEASAQANLAGKLAKLIELRLRYGQLELKGGGRDIELFETVDKMLGTRVPRPAATPNGV